MEAEKKQLWLFLAIIVVSSGLIAWSLVTLYNPMDSDYSEEYYDEEEESEAPDAQDSPEALNPVETKANAPAAAKTVPGK